MLRDEFERLALAELEPVYRFARSLTRDTDRAEELVQEVYARAFRAESIASFESRGGGMRAWLMTIARTRFYGMLEREQAGARVIEGARDLARCDSAGEDEAAVAVSLDALDWSAASGVLYERMGMMNAELREVLWLWGVEGLRYKEIAEVMSTPIGTVMSRLHRARAQAARVLLSDPATAAAVRRLGSMSNTADAGDRDGRP